MTATLTPSPDATAQTLLLEEHLRRLRLPVLLARYPKDSLNNNFPVWDGRGGDTRGA